MKLTSIQNKIGYSIVNSVHNKCFNKTFDSTSYDVWWKIRDEIERPNMESTSGMQIRTLDNLENEIN